MKAGGPEIVPGTAQSPKASVRTECDSITSPDTSTSITSDIDANVNIAAYRDTSTEPTPLNACDATMEAVKRNHADGSTCQQVQGREDGTLCDPCAELTLRLMFPSPEPTPPGEKA